jgi:homocysteine S-methyltransferase
MRGSEFLTRLQETVLLGDGAIGTMISERGVGRETNYERLNLTNPDFIQEIHRAYLAAGAMVIETNTFGANRTKLAEFHFSEDVAAINRAGVSLAREVVGAKAFLAGAVGPLARRTGGHEIAPLSHDDIRDIYREQIVALADAGVDLLMLETFSDLQQLLLAVEVARANTDLPVVCMMAFHERGHTFTGIHVATAVDALQQAGADVIGANCGRGVRCVASAVELMINRSSLPVCAYPNAGLPEYLDGRYLFGAPLPYLVDSALAMVERGVNLIGGCCGTTPAYVTRLAERLRDRSPTVRPQRTQPAVAQPPEGLAPSTDCDATVVRQPSPPAGSILHRRDPRPFIVVELDPPRDLHYEPVLQRSQELRSLNVDAITMGDNTVATLRMGNMALAQIVQLEADIPVVVHLTCRDHNLLGLQSLIMSAHVMGLHHLLALTGDPARVGDQPGATSVYDLQSFGLVELIRRFNEGYNNAGLPMGRTTRFTIGVAFNPNSRSLAGHVTRLRKKVACGAHFAMTQPIYDLERYRQMKALTTDLNIPILVGVMPLLSERNAEFVHNEVPGIMLTEDIRRRMKGLSGKAGRQVGMQICKELVDAMADDADGFYLIPPQLRTEMAIELTVYIQEKSKGRQLARTVASDPAVK